jgi:hypothetical protein
MDEIDFGPRREFRLAARYRRALAAVAAAGIVAAGAALTMHQITVNQAASPAPSTGSSPAPAACPPTQTTKPNLASLPAGMRPGALRVVADAQFSGECPG